jgi:GH18 family chitinase
METKDLKIGDTVMCVIPYPGYPQKGWRGKVVSIVPGFFSTSKEWDGYGIEWEYPFTNGHNCNGSGKDGYCRYYTNGSKLVDKRYLEKTALADILKKVEKQLELF